ncbi:hypothetical protein EBU71_14485, partial [bacterium]|nr:hypothetical protein [Candidatus Elulimicrobium humile]
SGTDSAPSNRIRLTASDRVLGDKFGFSCAFSKMHALVGAYNDDNTGSVYAYSLDGSQVLKITGIGVQFLDNFGFSLAAGCGVVVVGAPYDDDMGSNSGSVHIRKDYPFTHLQKITASDGATNDSFGHAVAVGSGMIAVGAPFDTPIGSTRTGSVYLYKISKYSTFSLYRKITPYNGVADDYFGEQIAIGCGRIVVGARGDDDNGTLSGSAYIFNKYGDDLKMITAPDGAAGDNFGISVAVGCGIIAVGASGHNSGVGAVYIFDLNGNYIKKLSSPYPFTQGGFGHSVAIGNGRIVVGAPTNSETYQADGIVIIYDLNGKSLGTIDSSNPGEDFQFGGNVAIGPGRILVGENENDDAFLFTTPLAYTPYDVAELNSLVG